MEADRMYNILNNTKSNLYKVFTPRFPFVRRINNKYRINILIKTKLNKEVYNEIYSKLSSFNQKKNKNLNMSITKNPTNIS